jgi:group I intron endonuclease
MAYGIYGVFNATQNKWYIGQSKDVEKRLVRHKWDLKCGAHHCKKMQADYSKGDIFVFTVIETEPNFPIEMLNAKENEYILRLSVNGANMGYNQIINTSSTGKAMRYIVESDRTIKSGDDEAAYTIYDASAIDALKAAVNRWKEYSDYLKNIPKKEADFWKNQADFWKKETDFYSNCYDWSLSALSKEQEMYTETIKRLTEALTEVARLKAELKMFSERYEIKPKRKKTSFWSVFKPKKNL